MEAKRPKAAAGFGDDLVGELIADMNAELGQLVSDFFNVALPSDAIVRIMAQLDVRTLVGCACVSRQWRAISAEDEVWHQVVGRLEAEVAARGADEASAVCSAARGRPDAGVRAWYRQRVERQRACDTNWRERVCVLQSGDCWLSLCKHCSLGSKRETA